MLKWGFSVDMGVELVTGCVAAPEEMESLSWAGCFNVKLGGLVKEAMRSERQVGKLQ